LARAAVAEFERAKIIERVTREKARRPAQGQWLGCCVRTFGYELTERQGLAFQW